MRLILRNTATEEVVNMNAVYAGSDISVPIVGMDPDLQYYAKVESDKPSFDPRTHRATKTETWTEDPWDAHAHILIYEIGWTEPELLSNEEIAENLKQEYVRFKEESYPTEKRDRDRDYRDLIIYNTAKGLTVDTVEEARQLVISTWQQTISAQYYSRKAALLDSGTLPSFIFTEFPSA